MDGTLVDTELLNEPVIRSVCAALGIACPDFDWTRFHGVSWTDIAREVSDNVDAAPDVASLARQFHRRYEKMCAEKPPAPIPGACDAVIGAHAHLPTGIVSSSFGSAIDSMIEQLNLGRFVTCRVGADDYPNSKPAPDGFLYAADLLGVDPSRCLVFEDSVAGIRSARSAGMNVIAVTYRSNVPPDELGKADDAITDYTELDADFFGRVMNR